MAAYGLPNGRLHTLYILYVPSIRTFLPCWPYLFYDLCTLFLHACLQASSWPSLLFTIFIIAFLHCTCSLKGHRVHSLYSFIYLLLCIGLSNGHGPSAGLHFHCGCHHCTYCVVWVLWRLLSLLYNTVFPRIKYYPTVQVSCSSDTDCSGQTSLPVLN